MAVHTGTRAYVFECSYDSDSWLDDPSTLISELQTELSGITKLSYQQLKIADVKNSSGSKVEVEIIGITYDTKTKLTASEIDDLIYDLNLALMNITNLSFLYIDICSDIFRDSPTAGWPDSSWKRG